MSEPGGKGLGHPKQPGSGPGQEDGWRLWREGESEHYSVHRGCRGSKQVQLRGVDECNCLVPEFPNCSTACVRLKRPVRCMLDRDEDMLVSGGRHPFYAKYKVGGCPLLDEQW